MLDSFGRYRDELSINHYLDAELSPGQVLIVSINEEYMLAYCLSRGNRGTDLVVMGSHCIVTFI